MSFVFYTIQVLNNMNILYLIHYLFLYFFIQCVKLIIDTLFIYLSLCYIYIMLYFTYYFTDLNVYLYYYYLHLFIFHYTIDTPLYL